MPYREIPCNTCGKCLCCTSNWPAPTEYLVCKACGETDPLGAKKCEAENEKRREKASSLQGEFDALGLETHYSASTVEFSVEQAEKILKRLKADT